MTFKNRVCPSRQCRSRIFLIRLPFSPQGKNRPPVSRGSRVSRDARYYCLTNVLQSGPPRRRRSFVSREKNGHKSHRKVPLETRCPTLASIYPPHFPFLKYLNSVYIHYFPCYRLFSFFLFSFLGLVVSIRNRNNRYSSGL